MNLYLLCIISVTHGVVSLEESHNSTTAKPPSTTGIFTKTECDRDNCMSMHGHFCLNDGKCIIDQSTCGAVCTCAKGYTGKRCEYEITSENDNVLQSVQNIRTKALKTGCSGEVCIHGECVPAPFGTTRCQCDEGWFGTNCGIAGAVVDDDILKGFSKRFQEIITGTDRTRLHNVSVVHVQKHADVSPSTEHYLNKSNITNSHLHEINKSTAADNSHSHKVVNITEIDFNDTLAITGYNPRYNVCAEDATERNDEERACEKSGDMACVYGVCEETLTDYGSWKGYTTVCKCDLGARGTFCEFKCCLDCGENGKCDVHVDGDNVTEHCNCRQRYTGRFCEIFVPNPVSVHVKEDTWYLWIVGVCVGTFVILVTLAVVGPYFMWKHRVILVMKIVHYFQAYEDDDEKEWDAFVSYKSHQIDERFVVNVLYPKLEKELGFKLCLHFRDFVPGETISNNIINAVEGSRRTILILTPRYVESEFTQFEYQKAQTEMLKRKHRIIPIMLEDISGVSNIDKNLKGIINSVTYLEWPKSEERAKKEEKFWKRLQLSLPKKKVNDSEKEKLCHMQNSYSSQSISFPVSSEKVSWFESSQKTNEKITSSETATTLISYDDSVYSEIGAIDESLSVMASTMSKNEGDGNSSETVKPLSEEEELELIYRGSNQDQDNKTDAQTDYYVDMEHDRYIEFTLDDNPPSESLTRKKYPTGIHLQNDGYIEVDV